MERYHYNELSSQAVSIAIAAGVPAPDAEILADCLIKTDLRGTATHGLSRLPVYVQRIRKGLIDPQAPLHVERTRPSCLLVDAANGLGQVQAVKTLRELEPVAREQGTATATIRNSGHFGSLSWYCDYAAQRGMILLAATNCEPSMVPTGGRAPFFGTNPVAASFPTGKGFNVTIDLATSKVARGNIIAANKQGTSIPEDWALDADGNPTTDPAAAMAGAVLPMAGHKGYALALLVEVLSGVLAGAAVGPEISSMYAGPQRPQGVGHFFTLMDIAAFMPPETFRSRMDAMIDAVKAVPRAPGVDEILVPGERSHRRMQENLRLGAPLNDGVVAELQELSRQYGLEWLPKEI